ncbi:MAG: gamma-glutamyl-gamma-aminobutyrate hydrolase family protein [Kiloniellales bacterium]
MNTAGSQRPLVGLPSCIKWIDGSPFHTVGDKYVRAVAEAADAEPYLIPALGGFFDLPALVHRLDGVVLTGSPSNVHPSHYAAPATPAHEPHDEARDQTTLPLIHETLRQGVPLLAICRGMQELNVALGGTLYARVHEVPDRMDHRRPKHEDLDVQYGPQHAIALTPGGSFEALAGAPEITVNSLHSQALDRVADGLQVEAVAPDGTVEAVRVVNARAFALGVQWHPEYRALENAFSAKLFAAFGDATRASAAARETGRLEPPQPAVTDRRTA